MLPETTILEIINTICSIIQSLLNNQERLLEQKAYQLLECASVYLKSDNLDEGLLRQSVQHIETAVSLFDTNPTIDRNNRIDLYNDLCVCIACLHKLLRDPEEVILFWVNKINISVCPPNTLRMLNQNYYKQKHNEYLVQKNQHCNVSYLDLTEDPVLYARTHYDY